MVSNRRASVKGAPNQARTVELSPAAKLMHRPSPSKPSQDATAEKRFGMESHLPVVPVVRGRVFRRQSFQLHSANALLKWALRDESGSVNATWRRAARLRVVRFPSSIAPGKTAPDGAGT